MKPPTQTLTTNLLIQLHRPTLLSIRSPEPPMLALPARVMPTPTPPPPAVSGRDPGRKFRWPLPPPSPVKPIMEAILKRQGKAQPKEEQGESTPGEMPLDKSFGFAKNIGAKYELGKQVGRGHFGHTQLAKAKKRECLRGSL